MKYIHNNPASWNSGQCYFTNSLALDTSQFESINSNTPSCRQGPELQDIQLQLLSIL